MAKKVVPFKVYKPARQEIVVPITTYKVPQDEIVLAVEEIEEPDAPVAVDGVKNVSNEIDYVAAIKLCMESDKLDEATKNELVSKLSELKVAHEEIEREKKELDIITSECVSMLQAVNEKLQASMKKVETTRAKWSALANKFITDQKILLAKFEASSKRK